MSVFLLSIFTWYWKWCPYVRQFWVVFRRPWVYNLSPVTSITLMKYSAVFLSYSGHFFFLHCIKRDWHDFSPHPLFSRLQISRILYFMNFKDWNKPHCQSQSPRGLRNRSAVARLLRLWVRIPPGTWMTVCCECCVLSGRVLCDELILLPEESYRL